MSKKNGSSASIREVYDLVEKKIGEVNASVLRLESKFDQLEMGRLSSLEKGFANLQGRLAIVAGIVSIVISVAVSLLSKIIK